MSMIDKNKIVLGVYMSILKKPEIQKDDYLVCACMEVMYSQILDEISKGATGIDDLAESLGVTTGCSSCVDEIMMILKEAKK